MVGPFYYGVNTSCLLGDYIYSILNYIRGKEKSYPGADPEYGKGGSELIFWGFSLFFLIEG